MVGGIITGKPPVNLSQGRRWRARISEYQVFVLPAESPLKSMAGHRPAQARAASSGAAARAAPPSIAAAMIARESAPTRPRSTTSPSVAAARRPSVLGGNVTVGGSGYTEFGEYIATKDAPDRVTSPTRLKDRRCADAQGAGLNVEIGNWRGVYGAPGINAEQRKALTELVKATKTKAWAQAVEANGWTPALLAGPEFDAFVDNEFASLRAVMAKAGMI